MQHLKEMGISAAGTMATAGLDIAGAPHWMCAISFALTSVYTILKIIVLIKQTRSNKDHQKYEL